MSFIQVKATVKLPLSTYENISAAQNKTIKHLKVDLTSQPTVSVDLMI